MELSEYVTVLRRHAIAIVLLACLGALAGFGLARSSTPLFKASSSLFVAAANGDNSSDLVQGSVYTQNQMQSYVQLARMPSVLQPVIAELGLDLTPAQLAASVSADAPLNTVLIVVTVVDKSPAEAARIANAVSASLATTAQDLSPKKANGTEAITMRQVAVASPPAGAFAPNTSLFVGVGGIVGLLLAVVFFVGRRVLDSKVGTGADFDAVAPVRVLGSIATTTGSARHVWPRWVRSGEHAQDSFRRLADQVLHLDAPTQVSSVVVTSPGVGEGKTHVALNLAVAMSERTGKVLLVDANLRSPRIAEICSLTAPLGLSDLIEGKANLRDVVQQRRSISILHAGTPVSDPTRLLNSQQMEVLVLELLANYDFVVFDAAGVLPVADTLPLTRLTGGALVVVQLHKTPKAQMAMAVASIQGVKGRVLGLVANRAAGSVRKRDRYPGQEYLLAGLDPIPSTPQSREEVSP